MAFGLLRQQVWWYDGSSGTLKGEYNRGLKEMMYLDVRSRKECRQGVKLRDYLVNKICIGSVKLKEKIISRRRKKKF